ncbi:YaaA family protein [Puniceibacterium confluentis]|uniref:YaaA family protein n=1 Tax=Puniceibacterium confluentis TaxID=1958944 RepID=UPI0011B457CF|nr:YaaA family protein [Puniceibacterium confluentis]
MLILLSPAKNVNEERAAGRAATTPRFLDEAEEIVSVARHWSDDEISQIMKVSSALAKLNRERFSSWSRGGECAAGLLFDGDVYKELELSTFDAQALDLASRRLRLLSGLYGLLRPTDGVQAYRMEMGRRCPGHPAGTLYKFWGTKIARAIADDARAIKTNIVLNLASEEYSKAVDPAALDDLTVISPRFEEERGGTRRVIGVSAKRARGAMARWVLHSDASEAGDLHGFDVGGYVFDSEASVENRPVFVRG